MIEEDYLQIARENEPVFRAVLRDIRDNRKDRPLSEIIPENMDTDSPIEKICQTYSHRPGSKFSILYFRVRDDRAVIGLQDTVKGSELGYKIGDNQSVQYIDELIDWEFKF